MILSFGRCSFDDVTGDVWENEPDEADDEYHDNFGLDDEDGEIVDVTETVKGVFGKGGSE